MDLHEERNQIFSRALKLIKDDETVPTENKVEILKLIQALAEASQLFPNGSKTDDAIQSITRQLISNYSLLMMVRQQADELDALKRLSLSLTSTLNLQEVLNSVVTEAMRLVKNSYAAHIYLYSEEGLSFGASLNAAGELNKPIHNPRPNGITYSAVRKGEPIIIEDMASHPLYKNLPRDYLGSIISIPLIANEKISGVMNLSRSVKGAFTQSELRLLSLLADQAAVAISNARLHQMVMDLANTDTLTGLPNRRALDERLQEEIRYARRMDTEFAVVMMDLDGFKEINDTFGHAVGDEMLRKIFRHLAGMVREVDFLARYGGDELTLVLRNTGLQGAETVTRKMIESLLELTMPYQSGKSFHVGITAGIAVYPMHTTIAGDLLRAADAALYQGKKHHRGSYVVAKKSTGPLPPLMNHQKK